MKEETVYSSAQNMTHLLNSKFFTVCEKLCEKLKAHNDVKSVSSHRFIILTHSKYLKLGENGKTISGWTSRAGWSAHHLQWSLHYFMCKRWYCKWVNIISLLYLCQVAMPQIRFLTLWNGVLTKKIQKPINSKNDSLCFRISSPKRAGNNSKNLSLTRKKKQPTLTCFKQLLETN